MISLDILSALFLLLAILLNAIFHHNWVFIGLNYNLLFLTWICCFEYLQKEKPNYE